MLCLLPRTSTLAVLLRISAMPARASHLPQDVPQLAPHLSTGSRAAASAAAKLSQHLQQRQDVQFRPPAGLPRALRPPDLPLPEGRFPKSALLEFFQGLLRREVAFRAETTAADSGVGFRCSLTTPPVDAVLSGWHVVVPELNSTAAGPDKKTAQHAAALDALAQLQGELQFEEVKSAESQQATIGEESVLQPSDDELDAIERVLGYMFRDRNLLRRAFWHPSLGAVNNARLALVGDAVLDVCALTDAYDAAPGMGALSVEDMNAYRTERCCRATCTRIADGMGLRRHVVTHACYIDLKGGRVPADSMIAEALEAIFGAVFEDAGKGGAGMDQAMALYKRHWPSAESWATQAAHRGGQVSSRNVSAARSASAPGSVPDEAKTSTPPASAPQQARTEAVSKRGLNGLAPAAAALESAKTAKRRSDAG